MSKKPNVPKIASRCDTCHGAGVLPGNCRDDELLPCPTCKGKGVITHKHSEKSMEERPCDNPNCHDGRVEQIQLVDGREVVTEKACPVCDGYGVIYTEHEEITTVHDKCPTCEGRGMLTAGEMRSKKIEDFCPVCHGTGIQVEEQPVKRLVKYGVAAFTYPVVTAVSTAFQFMVRSVKTVISTKLSERKK